MQKMKTATIVFLTIFPFFTFSQSINIASFQSDLETFFVRQCGKTLSVAKIEPVYSLEGDPMYLIFHLNSGGFILCGSDSLLPPVIAYSSSGSISSTDKSVMLLVRNTGYFWHSLENKNPGWEKLKQYEKLAEPIYWPAQGTTTTGGWVETRWTQSAPYDDFCPMDPLSNQRSIAGCPSVAMSQILNYWKTTQNTRFDIDDRYYHSYGGRNFWIDDDYQTYDFPSFVQLNKDLDTLDAHYQSGVSLTNKDKAAIVFACGIACTQVYSSSGSGTFGVSQAFAAYQRFAFNDCILYTDSSSDMLNTLISDMQNAQPAHLAVVDESDQYGHNVVVDGYNTDGYFHLNFGWGGSSDGWWLVPDTTFPYQMSVIEGVITGIHPQMSAGMVDFSLPLTVYPNPCNDVMFIKGLPVNCKEIVVLDLQGREVLKTRLIESTFSTKTLNPGFYFLKANDALVKFTVSR